MTANQSSVTDKTEKSAKEEYAELQKIIDRSLESSRRKERLTDEDLEKAAQFRF